MAMVVFQNTIYLKILQDSSTGTVLQSMASVILKYNLSEDGITDTVLQSMAMVVF